ncbi:hypothetical protein AX17_007381 [Amanita inopinata Kibby_2008]|nr:hypothetical protein AX17_007381 [Amanita inopinata Kibby_2008]
MSSNINNQSGCDKIHHSDPIPISSRLGRHRSVSASSGSSESSSVFDISTPISSSANSQRITIPSPTGSPILSYFYPQSPTKAPMSTTFPFKRNFVPPPVPEDDEKAIPVAAHMRRASVNAAGRFGQPQNSGSIPDSQLERGAGFLRRLSLNSTSFNKPQIDTNSPTMPPSPPPNSATSPTTKSPLFSSSPTKTRRSFTMDNSKTRRAPSPMGERILTGHFDGFN